MRRVGVGARISHRQEPGPVVLEPQPALIVAEGPAKDRVDLGARLVDKPLDDAVKGTALRV
jgi:hypothetical protein